MQNVGSALLRWDVLLLVWSLFALSALVVALRKKKDNAAFWKKYFVYLFVVHLLFAAIAFDVMAIAAMVIIVLAGNEVLNLKNPEHPVKLWKRLLAVLFFALLAFGFLFFSAKTTRENLWIFYAAIVVFDGISQLAGQAFGKTHFTPRISPNKTLEGFLTGWLFAFGSGVLLGGFAKENMILFALLGPVALCGDLLASAYKRLHRVKDYATWIPGHGGVLDRFDSFLFSGAVIYYGMLLTALMRHQ